MSPSCKIVFSLNVIPLAWLSLNLRTESVTLCARVSEEEKLLGNSSGRVRSFFFLLRIANSPMNSPEPATPTVAAPAPMNLAAESISRVAGEVWNERTCGRRATGVEFWAANVWL